MYNQNIPDINQEDRTQQDGDGNMYSYRDDNQNVKETGAIRRSLGDNNPNAGFPQNNFGSDNVQNYNNNGGVGLQYSQQDINNSSIETTSSFWVTYLIFGIFEIVIIIILCFFLELQIKLYDNSYSENYDFKDEEIENIYFNYELLRDMNIMVFIGFGMMHSILRRSSWTSISFNILLTAFSIQFALLFNYLWHNGFKEKWEKEYLDFVYLMKAIFMSSPTLISLGCVIGRLSLMQYLIMAIMETILSCLNYQLCERKLESIDVGGAMYIHTFGAIFGISISMVLFCSKKVKSELQKYNQMNKSSYFSNLTTFLGIIFLFSFFPSFNSALSSSDKDIEVLSNLNITTNITANITMPKEIEFQKQRGRINTYFSLIGSIVGSFITSGLFNKGRFIIEEILYGCLSGGIIISGCCTVCFYHSVAMIIGTLWSVIIVIFLSKVKPFFIKSGFKDTFNVALIHGFSGILGALITPMFIGGFEIQFKKTYGDNWKDRFKYIFRDDTREYYTQAGIQVGALFITLGVSFVGGIATGYLMKISTCGKINQYFTDIEFFKEEENNIFDYVESNTLISVDINNPSLFPKKMVFPSSDQKKEKISEIGGNQPSYYN